MLSLRFTGEYIHGESTYGFGAIQCVPQGALFHTFFEIGGRWVGYIVLILRPLRVAENLKSGVVLRTVCGAV